MTNEHVLDSEAGEEQPGRLSVFPHGPPAWIWVLDDSATQAAMAAEVLAPLAQVRVFHDSPQLLEALTEDRPDVMVLDLHVPDISGLEVLQMVRGAHDEVTLPVLMLTAARGTEDSLEALTAGANDYAIKPFVAGELRARVATLLRVQRLHARAKRAERELALALAREGAARAQAEAGRARLAESEERQRRVVDASGAGLWELDVSTGRVEADERMLTLMGAPLDQTMTVESGFAAVHRDDVGRLEHAVRSALAGENGGRYAIEFRTGGHGDVPLRWLESRAQARFDEKGGATRLAGALIDVTARKLAEQQREGLSEDLRTREAELRLVTDALPVLISFVTPDERYGLVNRAYEDWFGIPAPQLLGRKIRDVIGDAAYGVLSPFVKRALAGERFTFEQHQVPYRLGGKRDVRVSFIPLRMGEQRSEGYVALLEDITAQRAFAAEREQMFEQSAETMRRQSLFEQQLIGIVSHDLRTPLNVIGLSSARLARDEELTPNATKNVVRIQNAAHRAARMVADLLDFTQARLGGGIRIERRSTNLHELVDAMVSELEAAYPNRQIECTREGDGTGEWDPERVTQAAQNLIGNALKYSPADSVVRVTTRTAAGNAELIVHNRGTPIAEHKLPVLFEPMQRGVERTDTVTRSVGLGLYIVKQIAEAHGGAVSVHSSEADGTTFSATFSAL